jgi:tetratricopeptide (TPR) repeat protein
MPAAAAAAPSPKPRSPRVSAKSLPPRTRLIAIAAAAVLAIGAAVYFFVLRSPAPRPGGAVSAPGGPSLEDAMVLFREGKVEETAAALRRIPPSHPDYARAQKLLASLGSGGGAAPSEGGAPAPEGEGGATASSPQENEPARLRALAERALAEKRYIDALTSFNLAAPSYSADPEFARARASAIEKVTELTPAVKLYNEAEYETAIPILWRIHSADRENQDARSYLFRAYYNQGIAQLQNGLYEKAQESFREAAALNTGDEEAARHQKFAQRYEKRDLDLMGRIYVRHVQPRP